MLLHLSIKSFNFELTRNLRTSQGYISGKHGWLIHLEDQKGNNGWGEVAPINLKELENCNALLNSLVGNISKESLESKIIHSPGSLAFGIGGALAEINKSIGDKTSNKWLTSKPSSFLLPTDECPIKSLNHIISSLGGTDLGFSFKWKVGYQKNINELRILEKLLNDMPINSQIRIDANGGWTRKEANAWLNLLIKEPRLEWVEQPLEANDMEGLWKLAEKIPIALDESLRNDPSLKDRWEYWQIRRPAIEGDPRLILKELKEGKKNIVISTAFETGIGRRWINHLASLQLSKPSSAAPGLAPGWCPNGDLFSTDPRKVWEAA